MMMETILSLGGIRFAFVQVELQLAKPQPWNSTTRTRNWRDNKQTPSTFLQTSYHLCVPSLCYMISNLH